MTDPTDLRRQAALSKGLPPELADRLRGNTQEELEQDADTLRAAVSQPTDEEQFDAYMRQHFPQVFRDQE